MELVKVSAHRWVTKQLKGILLPQGQEKLIQGLMFLAYTAGHRKGKTLEKWKWKKIIEIEKIGRLSPNNLFEKLHRSGTGTTRRIRRVAREAVKKVTCECGKQWTLKLQLPPGPFTCTCGKENLTE